MNRLSLIALVADNFDTLLEHDAVVRNAPRLTHEALAAKAKIGQGTVGRLARQESAPRVDTLEAIAGVFGLRGWQMLAGPLDPAAPPELLTPDVRKELVELRAMRAQLEEITRGGPGPRNPPSLGRGNPGDSQGGGREQVPDEPATRRRR